MMGSSGTPPWCFVVEGSTSTLVGSSVLLQCWWIWISCDTAGGGNCCRYSAAENAKEEDRQSLCAWSEEVSHSPQCYWRWQTTLEEVRRWCLCLSLPLGCGVSAVYGHFSAVIDISLLFIMFRVARLCEWRILLWVAGHFCSRLAAVKGNDHVNKSFSLREACNSDLSEITFLAISFMVYTI